MTHLGNANFLVGEIERDFKRQRVSKIKREGGKQRRIEKKGKRYNDKS